jgi:hypothetical protein
VGNIDSAIDYLVKAQDEKSAWILWLGTEPKLDSLRGDPRFQQILEKVGLRSAREVTKD